MVLPDPTLSFTIPSIHDDTTLDCRLYIPHVAKNSDMRRAAIIAHPYAPLGGCFDDPVVGLVSSEILKSGWIVGTFNFRGASGSKGRTSWTGKAEVGDYTSFAGLLIYYLHELDGQCNNSDNKASEGGLKEQNSQAQQDKPLRIVIGGYSYGSMIASKLPSIEYLLYRFSTGADGTAFTEIILRARGLAQQTREELQTPSTSNGRESHDSTRHYGANLHVGGEETSPEHRRRSHEGRISSEIHRSVQSIRKLSGLKKPADSNAAAPENSSTSNKPEPKAKPAYLLISPLLPPISSLTALSFSQASSKTDKEELQTRLSTNPSLAVFGSDDIFTSTKKLRAWAQSISGCPNSSFQFVEIDGAGHFWHEDGVEKRLRLAVREWIRGLEGLGS